MAKLSFASDYMEGAHPRIMKRLMETNLEKTAGYGTDEYCEAARAKIREACGAPEADVFFLVGGTQTNATCINALLRTYEGVIAADTGHVALHEAGAIENGGHKVLTIRQELGKITAADVQAYMDEFHADGNKDHIVQPGMVYISQPTEYGSLYSLEELTAISEVCRNEGLHLYVDGARLAYALASPANDVKLADLARLADVFYIGGTKCGALFGEAVVIPKAGYIPHFFTIMKQNGALLAKGRLLGVQYDVLFTDDMYLYIGGEAVRMAGLIQDKLVKKGYDLLFRSPTNQIFPVLDDKTYEKLSKKVEVSFWEKPDADHTIVRIATSWATTEEDVEELIRIL